MILSPSLDDIDQNSDDLPDRMGWIKTLGLRISGDEAEISKALPPYSGSLLHEDSRYFLKDICISPRLNGIF